MVLTMMRVGMIVVPGFDVMSFAPLSVFDAANIGYASGTGRDRSRPRR
jgi:hypothetical protein